MLGAAADTWTGIAAVARRDAQRAASYRVALLTVAVSEIFALALFYYISRLISAGSFDSPDDYFAFVVVGLITLQLGNAVLYLPVVLIQGELLTGTFERLVTSPLGAVNGVVGMMVFPFLAAVGTSVAVMAAAVIVFGAPIEATALLAIPASPLVGAALAPLGLVVVAVGLLIKQAAGVVGFLVTGIALVAGLYFPVALLPGWIEWISAVQPVTPAVELMRELIIGRSDGSILGHIARLTAFAAVMLPPAVWILTRALLASRRRGTTVEY